MYIKWPDGVQIRRELARDRRYWAEVYKQKQQSMCPDTKQALDVKACYACDFFLRVKGKDVFCALAGGWIRHT